MSNPFPPENLQPAGPQTKRMTSARTMKTAGQSTVDRTERGRERWCPQLDAREAEMAGQERAEGQWRDSDPPEQEFEFLLNARVVVQLDVTSELQFEKGQM